MVNYVIYQMEKKVAKGRQICADSVSFECTNPECGIRFKEDQMGEVFCAPKVDFRCFICKGVVKDIRLDLETGIFGYVGISIQQ